MPLLELGPSPDLAALNTNTPAATHTGIAMTYPDHTAWNTAWLPPIARITTKRITAPARNAPRAAPRAAAARASITRSPRLGSV